MKQLILLAFLSGLLMTEVWAHPGRTAADGCHYCRTNCASWGVPAGQRHCHNGSSASSPRYDTSGGHSVQQDSVTQTETLRVQTLLQRLGYNPGPIDGILGARTRKAVEAFQKDHSLTPTGKIGSQLIRTLENATAN